MKYNISVLYLKLEKKMKNMWPLSSREALVAISYHAISILLNQQYVNQELNMDLSTFSSLF